MDLLNNIYENFGSLFVSWLIFESALMLVCLLVMQKFGVEVDFNGGKKRENFRQAEDAFELANEDLRNKCYEYLEIIDSQNGQINSIMNKNADLIKELDKLKNTNDEIKLEGPETLSEFSPRTCEFWSGWFTLDSVSSDGFVGGWKSAALRAHDEGYIHHVFKIPDKRTHVYVVEIEKLLQKMTLKNE